MNKLKAFTLSTPVVIVSLIVLIATGTYLSYAIYQSKQIEEVETPAAIAEPLNTSGSSNTSSSSLPSEPSLPSTTDETADWQTYTNTDYDFSFQYPKEWEINQNSKSSSSSELLVSFKITDQVIAPKNFEVSHSTREIGLIPSTTIGGKKAVKGNQIQGVESKSQSVTIQLDDGTYLDIFAEGSALDNFDQILATFKFTD